MGKATKWFRNILGLRKPDPTLASSANPTSKEKRRWSFVKSYREKDSSQNATIKRDSLNVRETSVVDDTQPIEGEDASRHAIAVAAATAVVAEAAVAAAHAAAAVVRLTSDSGRSGNFSPAFVGGCVGTRYELAAIKIQSIFRGYLARRALRALRGLVRLQALVRGHIERKRTAEWLQCMQALLRAQARARAGRAQISGSSQSSGKSSHFQQPGPPTPEKFEHSIRSKNSKFELSSVLKKNGSKSSGRVNGDRDMPRVSWNSPDHLRNNRLKDLRGTSTKIGTTDDEKSDKILEIDTGKLHFTPKHRNLFHSTHLTVSPEQYSHSFTTSKDSTGHQTEPSPSSCEVQSLSPFKFHREVEDFYIADNSPQFCSASSRGGSLKRSPFSPSKSHSSQSCLSGYLDHPNYMAYTESSRAKVRSFSAPKQRPQYQRSGSTTKRYSTQPFGESKPNAQRFTALQASFLNKAYPGSGRLDSFGMPVGHRF